MKEIIERNIKELEEEYDYYLNKEDESRREVKWIEDRLHDIRSKINILECIMEEYYESKNNNK